jgi:outer membrane protein assembly factor BamB
MAHEVKNLPAELTEETLKWEVDFRVRNVFAQPMVIGNKVLLGTGARCFSSSEIPKGEKSSRYGILWCLDRQSGKVLWRFIHRSRGYGLVSQPTQEGDRLYLLTSAGVVCCLDLDGLTDGNDGMDNELSLIELDAGQDPGKLDAHVANSGADVIWAFDTRSRLGARAHDSASGTPLIVGDQLWVPTSHACGVRPASAWHKKGSWWPDKPAANLVVLDKNTGMLKAVDKQPIPEVFHGQWSSPTLAKVDGRKLVIWGDGYGVVHAFAVKDYQAGAELEEVWRCDANPRSYRLDEQGNERPYAHHGQKDKSVRAQGPCDIIATPVFYEGKVYVGIGRDLAYGYKQSGRETGAGAITCIDPSGRGDVTGSHIVWQNTQVGRTQSTPAIADGLVYTAGTDGFVNCLDAATGREIWKQDVEATVAERSMVLADGKLYVGTDRGMQWVLRAGREPEVLFKRRIKGHPTSVGLADGFVILPATGGIEAHGTK